MSVQRLLKLASKFEEKLKALAFEPYVPPPPDPPTSCPVGQKLIEGTKAHGFVKLTFRGDAKSRPNHKVLLMGLDRQNVNNVDKMTGTGGFFSALKSGYYHDGELVEIMADESGSKNNAKTGDLFIWFPKDGFTQTTVTAASNFTGGTDNKCVPDPNKRTIDTENPYNPEAM